MSFNLNGQNHEIPVDWADEPLLFVLREHFGLTGAKFGCGVGICRACTIILDGVATRACTIPASASEGLSVRTIEGLRNRLVADPVRRWTVASLAAETGASPRTLQRRLTERSVSFSRLVTDARVEVAATHLCKANGPALAEIAFIAGFSDQAHFARVFSRAVGTTPSGYRADFGL